jgi:two-component system NarL family response regulator
MRERVEEVGGSLQVRSAPGRGTHVIAQMPLARALSPAPEIEGGAEGEPLRVLLADDHPLFLEGLRNLLAARGVQVVGMAFDGLEARELAHSLRPDVILMDVQMPRCDGIEATRRIKAELPEVKIVMLTVSEEEETLFEALESGASGYLLKNLNSGVFFDQLADLARGEIALAPGLAVKVLAEFARRGGEQEAEKDAAEARLSKLTPRQAEVLKRVAQGLTYKEVGEALHVSERTVKYHMGQILTRLHLQNRREAVQFARRNGLDALAGD